MFHIWFLLTLIPCGSQNRPRYIYSSFCSFMHFSSIGGIALKYTKEKRSRNCAKSFHDRQVTQSKCRWYCNNTFYWNTQSIWYYSSQHLLNWILDFETIITLQQYPPDDDHSRVRKFTKAAKLRLKGVQET